MFERILNSRLMAFFFYFLLIIFSLVLLPNYYIAAWFGVLLAMFSAVSNDSIQTLGTFLSSNYRVKWWILWIFVGAFFLIVTFYGWFTQDHEIHYGRLNKIPAVTELSVVQLLAPVTLLVLSYFKVPVSTTFLLLSVFSASSAINSMLTKTFIGYIVSFLSAIAIWYVLEKLFYDFFRRELTPKETRFWTILQWCSTAFLWSTWLAQDLANIVVFLPRKLSIYEVSIFAFVGLIMLAIIMYRRGGSIQGIVLEKSDVLKIHSATVIDFVLALILFIFGTVNKLPMSTTWVFLGLLAGREFIIIYMITKKYNMELTKSQEYTDTLFKITKDIFFASIGVVVSLSLALMPRFLAYLLKFF